MARNAPQVVQQPGVQASAKASPASTGNLTPKSGRTGFMLQPGCFFLPVPQVCRGTLADGSWLVNFGKCADAPEFLEASSPILGFWKPRWQIPGTRVPRSRRPSLGDFRALSLSWGLGRYTRRILSIVSSSRTRSFSQMIRPRHGPCSAHSHHSHAFPAFSRW